jgi:hypothetical protein
MELGQRLSKPALRRLEYHYQNSRRQQSYIQSQTKQYKLEKTEMILSFLRQAIPYRRNVLIVLFLSNAMYIIGMNRNLSVFLYPGVLVPDASIKGYSPKDALVWYTDIGPQGRAIYVYLAMMDLLLIIPSYTCVLGSQLMAGIQHLNYQNKCQFYYDTICLIPIITMVFDLMETSTHARACFFYPILPSTTMIFFASAATGFKFAGLFLSMVFVGWFWIRHPKPVMDKNKKLP